MSGAGGDSGERLPPAPPVTTTADPNQIDPKEFKLRQHRVFQNQLPERLEAEMNTAQRVGARVMTPADPQFQSVVNEGTIKFVVTQEGQLLVTPQYVQSTEISHAFLSGGRGVVTAGQAEISAVNGRFFGIRITEHSGHFMPSQQSLQIARELFERYGITFPR
jgi:hypothetical protein